MYIYLSLSVEVLCKFSKPFVYRFWFVSVTKIAMCFKFAVELQTFKTSDYKNMLQYLMKSCILFDCTFIYLFQGYYLILNCKKVPWNRKKERLAENSNTRAWSDNTIEYCYW